MEPTPPPVLRRVSVVVGNDAFTDRVTDVPRLMRDHHVGLWQEVKRHNLRRELPDVYGVHQERGRGREGVAVTWDERLLERVGRGYQLLTPGFSDPSPKGTGMEGRWVVWVDLEDKAGRVVRYASCHRPPPRYRKLWPAWDAQLRDWWDESPHPIVCGMDANQRGGPDHNMRGVRWAGVGIDGALVSAPFTARPTLMARLRSDHRPISLTIKEKP